MAQVKLGLDTLTNSEAIAFANNVVKSMTGNAAFPTPNPALTAITAAVTALTNTAASIDQLEQQLKALHVQQDSNRVALDDVLTKEAIYIQQASGGDEQKILSAGVFVREDAKPITSLEVPLNVSASAGDLAGEVDLQWDSVKGARSYPIQYSVNPADESLWRDVTVPTFKSKTTVQGLKSGTKYWFRVQAAGSRTTSGWSDSATCVCP